MATNPIATVGMALDQPMLCSDHQADVIFDLIDRDALSACIRSRLLRHRDDFCGDEHGGRGPLRLVPVRPTTAATS